MTGSRSSAASTATVIGLVRGAVVPCAAVRAVSRRDALLRADGGGYFYVLPASVVSGDRVSWAKELSSEEGEVDGERCLYVGGASGGEVRRGACLVGGARSALRVFRLVGTSVADEYGISSPGGACWRPDAGADKAATAGEGVRIAGVESADGCGGVSQRWRIEPIDPSVSAGGG